MKRLLFLILFPLLFGCMKNPDMDYSIVLDENIEVIFNDESGKATVTVKAKYDSDFNNIKQIGFMRSLNNKFDNYLFPCEVGLVKNYKDPLYDMDTDIQSVEVKASDGEMSITFSNLDKDEVFYVKAYIFTEGSPIYSEQVAVVSSTRPFVENCSDWVSVTATTAMLYGKVQSNGGSDIKDFGVYIDTQNPPKYKISAESLGDDGSYFVQVNNLDGASIYYAAFYAKNNNGETVTEPVPFTTQPYGTPVIDFAENAFPTIVPTSIEVAARIIDFGGDPNARCGVRYGVAEGPLDQTFYADIIDPEGYFSVQILSLEPDTPYYFAPFIETKNELKQVGARMCKTTDTSVPLVETYSLQYDVDFKSEVITFKGKIISDGGLAITDAGFYWGRNADGTDLNKVSVPVESIREDGSFVATVQEGVSSMTEYYFRAYAINSKGESESDDVKSLTTGVPDRFVYQYGVNTSTTPYTYFDEPNKDKMGQDIELHYYMLEPIVVTIDGVNKRMILLDRNLGATKRALETHWDKDAVGYYYIWGTARPQISPSNIGDEKTKVSTISGPQDLPKTENVDWKEEYNPCPEGFKVPSSKEWQALTDVVGMELNTRFSFCNTGDYQGSTSVLVNSNTVMLWSSTHVEELSTQTNPKAYFLQINNGCSIASIGMKRAKPVRCVKVLSE